jgi:hypothetical protein
MADDSRNIPQEADPTAFVTREYYVLGAGETVTDVRTSGQWLATDDPVEVRP